MIAAAIHFFHQKKAICGCFAKKVFDKTGLMQVTVTAVLQTFNKHCCETAEIQSSASPCEKSH